MYKSPDPPKIFEFCELKCINLEYIKKSTPLHMVANSRDDTKVLEATELLLSFKADVVKEDKAGEQSIQRVYRNE